MMVEPFEAFARTLRHHGFSLTRPRQLLFAALQNKEPQTMAEIISACQGQIDRASVYRAILLFEQLHIVKRLQIGWKYKLELSDAFHRHHHHLTCLRCGTTSPLPEDEMLEKMLDGLAVNQNFVMQDHQLEIQGLCATCLKS